MPHCMPEPLQVTSEGFAQADTRASLGRAGTVAEDAKRYFTVRAIEALIPRLESLMGRMMDAHTEAARLRTELEAAAARGGAGRRHAAPARSGGAPAGRASTRRTASFEPAWRSSSPPAGSRRTSSSGSSTSWASCAGARSICAGGTVRSRSGSGTGSTRDSEAGRPFPRTRRRRDGADPDERGLLPAHRRDPGGPAAPASLRPARAGRDLRRRVARRRGRGRGARGAGADGGRARRRDRRPGALVRPHLAPGPALRGDPDQRAPALLRHELLLPPAGGVGADPPARAGASPGVRGRARRDGPRGEARADRALQPRLRLDPGRRLPDPAASWRARTRRSSPRRSPTSSTRAPP